MKIGEVAKLTGLSTKAIRHYHDIGLVVAVRSDNGYREYLPKQQQALLFVARCKALGFSLDQCGQLLHLYENESREAAEVKALAKHQLELVRNKLAQLAELERELTTLVAACQGGTGSDCAILAALGSVEPGAKIEKR